MNDHPLDPLLDPTPGGTPRPDHDQGDAREPRPRRRRQRHDAAAAQAGQGAAVDSTRASSSSGAARTSGSPTANWVPAAAAIGLLGTVVLAGVLLGGRGDDGDGGSDVPAAEVAGLVPEPPAVALTVPESVPDVTSEVADAPEVEKVPLDRTLSKGLAGDDVRRVQQRLTDLGFAPGPIDGIYGDQTIKAVWAYEKLVLDVPSNQPTGRITPEMWDRMQDNFRINPRRPNAPSVNHTEVYLPEQVVAVFQNDVPVLISHMSSGTGEEWCEEVTISPGEYGNRDGEEPIIRGECGISNTPGGVFEVYRQVEGIRDSALGSMWDPVYFNYGIAIHGALNVPLQPASHGCIRVPLSLSPILQDLIENGDFVYVWDGVKEPEENGSPPPTFNWLDPDYDSTTTTSSTTVPETTTTVPATTEAPATTTAPASTASPTTQAPDTTVAPTTAAPTTAAPTTTAAPATTSAPTTLAPPPDDLPTEDDTLQSGADNPPAD
ncbi:MAG: L,D-transpeptidase family protein [Actinomycetota bacterium]